MNNLKLLVLITFMIFGFSSLKPACAQGYVGNLYAQIQPASTVSLINAGDEISERFTLMNPVNNNATTNNVTALFINIETNTPSLTYSVGIQTDDGSVNHLPTGTWVVEAPNITLPNNPWNTVAVTSTTLTYGQIYHLVIQVSATGTTPNTFAFWTPDNFLIPNGPVTVNGTVTNSPVTDLELNYLTNLGGAGWSVGGGNPTFGLGFSDGSVYGVPYSNVGSDLIYGNAGAVTYQAAQLFTFPTNIYFGSVGAYVQRSSTPSNPLQYYVETESGTPVVNGTLTTSSGIAFGLTNQWVVSATFTPTTLSAGITYRMILESNGTNTTSGYYDWVNYSTIPALNLATYGAGALPAQTSADGGNTWTNVADSNSSFELGLVATPTPTNTPTNTSTNTATNTATSTATSSPTNTPTFTPTLTITPTFTFTPTITSSPTSTPTPPYDASDLGKAVLAPVPAPAGTNVCLYFDKPPVSCTWDVFNVLGQRVATLSFAQTQGNCWNTTGVPPGVYFVEIKITYQDGTTAQIMKKAVISP